MTQNINRPAVGVAVAVIKDGMVLLGKRKGSHAAGTYSFPGGHLEYAESLEACCHREVKEEAGITIKNLRLWCVTNDLFNGENKHCLTMVYLADYDSGEVTLKEPEKCEGWDWYKWHTLPTPLMEPIQKMKENHLYPDSLRQILVIDC